MSFSEVYKYPEYYALGYRWNTDVECDFIEAALRAYGPPESTRLLDVGCGSGRHMRVLAGRGFQLTGVDVSPEMVAYVEEQARGEQLPMAASVGDLRRLAIGGTFDAAYCFMDTFRFLLTNQDIVAHLRAVAERLVTGGLYLTDFWVPSQWDMIGGEIHQWEQTEGDRTVRVFYLQHPETIDPINQTFEDELVFEIHEQDESRTIRGGPTRTRLLMPHEFAALVDSSGVFELASTHGDFDLTKLFDRSSLSWRMISVLKKR